MKLVKDTDKIQSNKDLITDQQAEEAFKTILKWIGEDPNREGLLETPKRVVKAFRKKLTASQVRKFVCQTAETGQDQ